MKNWEGERPREPFARKTHVPLAREDARPPTLLRMFSQLDGPPEGRSYFGYTLQPATLVLNLE